MGLLIDEYLSWVSVDTLQTKKTRYSDSERAQQLNIQSNPVPVSRLTWLDSFVSIFEDHIELKLIPEDNLAFLDIYETKAIPILHGKHLPGSEKQRIYSDLLIPINKRGMPMFTKINIKESTNKNSIQKLMIIIKLLAKSFGSYSSLMALCESEYGREIISHRLTSSYLQKVNGENITKMVRMIGKNLNYEPETYSPFVMIQTNDEDKSFSHYLSYNKFTDKIYLCGLETTSKGEKFKSHFKGFKNEDSEIFRRPVCFILLNIPLIIASFKH
jgi:hypothetical protein